MEEITSITYQAPSGWWLKFAVTHTKPIGFYVVTPADEDKIVHGSYQCDNPEDVLEMLLRALSDIALLVDTIVLSITRREDEDGGTVFYSHGFVRK